LTEFPFLHYGSYTWEVIDLLVGLHSGEELGLDMVVSPTDVKVEAGDGVGLQPPLIFFGDMLHHGILGFCMLEGVPLTLMMTLFFLVLI
jgi:hypothetical protein